MNNCLPAGSCARAEAPQKRALAVHDVSCFGRCSLTVALPVLSAAGIETSVIPTAILSTHTGGFAGFTCRDLTDDILPIVEHWLGLGIGFDVIYTGYLGSFEQIAIVERLFGALKGVASPGGVAPLVVCDPVMADNGKLYSLFPENFPEGMRALCAKADVITPNLTEAALMLGEPYNPGPLSECDVKNTLLGLAALGSKKVVLTGVGYDADTLGAASYDAESGFFGYAGEPRVAKMYHGTGDVFASALTAALTCGRDLAAACEIAVAFTVAAISRTKAANTDNRFGVNFEAGLSGLSALINRVPEI